MKRFLTWLVLDEGERIVRVKSWMPVLCRDHRGQLELTWPCLLVDTRGGIRMSMSPVWDRVRFSKLIGM